jgi:hypothetical protein
VRTETGRRSRRQWSRDRPRGALRWGQGGHPFVNSRRLLTFLPVLRTAIRGGHVPMPRNLTCLERYEDVDGRRTVMMKARKGEIRTRIDRDRAQCRVVIDLRRSCLS